MKFYPDTGLYVCEICDRVGSKSSKSIEEHEKHCYKVIPKTAA